MLSDFILIQGLVGREHFLSLSCRVNELPRRVQPPQKMRYRLCGTPPKIITFHQEIFSKSFRIHEKKWADWFKLGKTSTAAVAHRTALELLHIFDCSLNTFLKYQNLLKGGHIPPPRHPSTVSKK